MTDPRTTPDPLGVLTDQLTADLVALLIASDKQVVAERFMRTLSDWSTKLIERAAAQAASVSIPIIQKVEDFEKRERRRYERLRDLEATVNHRVDVLYEQSLTPEERAHHLNRIDQLEADVQRLKERQADDGAG